MKLSPPKLLLTSGLTALLLFVSGCSTTSRLSRRMNAELDLITQEIQEADAKLETRGHAEIPIEINDEVRRWVDYFSVRDRDRFETFLNRGAYFRPMIEKLLLESQVPAEMFYLAMIESGFVTHARSPASAVGVWQFIRSTGRHYGLSQSRYLDERRDVIRATRAAARYLRDLHDEFGSWYLAMAAYNAGEGRIRRAIRNGGSRDFWTLARQKALPRETMNYVPKFLAAWIIGRQPRRFGFETAQTERFPAVESALVPGAVDLDEIAKIAGIESQVLSDLNPHLVRGITPPEKRSYPIWLPQGMAERLASPGMLLVQKIQYNQAAPEPLQKRRSRP